MLIVEVLVFGVSVNGEVEGEREGLQTDSFSPSRSLFLSLLQYLSCYEREERGSRSSSQLIEG